MDNRRGGCPAPPPRNVRGGGFRDDFVRLQKTARGFGVRGFEKLFPKNQCKCEASGHQGSYNFEDAYGQSDLPAVKPNLPFGYPVHGVEVMPLHTVPIPERKLRDLVTIATKTFLRPHKLMTMLQSIQRKLRDLVTIATKTFLRPHKLMTMLQSIHLTVIVADDSKEPLKINDSHVEYYTMPYGKGWFAGRNLAISQVTTKYVLWVDDDFLFNDKTKIEVLVDVLEKTGRGKGELLVLPHCNLTSERGRGGERKRGKYVKEEEGKREGRAEGAGEGLVQEVMQHSSGVETITWESDPRVGGSVLGNVFQFKLFLEHSENGDCLHRRSGSFWPLDGFPSCVVTSGVVNFFLAHTERLQRVGFDPRLQRVAHSEFFIDGLGSLLVGSCSNVIVGHQPRSPVADPELAALEKSYNVYRTNTKAQIQFKLALHYFKNHLQCAT
ncbi:hypothetical protein EI555_011549 [Monodon monoceros]|uniref:Glycosyltransferase 2-like domain-containing protein n=1 Tax=Monodon monoceros TaxID=40151 RepID=A0A4U1FNE9_MONMO|nr:hypothetical protein EI555_011549 [Monodon monoceros]